ncbi:MULTISPECIES: carbohydrate ABC transporter permease [Rhizobium]|uniref:Maltose ABC transporter membrane protein /trehalose ABC transporter membrane protein /sucrose ABC transporter membrane protein n=1 Tax=Rhizobium laguerreae TaxID=1076926 RepID=A0AAX2QG47_9HYPH|nr:MULTISPECIES: carbohydrate ABC transporter permease [Rhizobium]KAF5881083.1 carbohydrate ABC transporter permease [Rhizobium sp. PEPV16]MBN9981762.1 carbohydrate ABC transporter permease [Rhizobium laguerreae]MBY3090299.1 carbohydrate ABC transporter permease [Rhizobium laguerreae]MBY3124618.1 carbohydrate ABC transporter permease [Rhizobium laguerreae]MBY3202209.1 carbohydrate ABC transporter permease [Rhizobium laguerreae]
MTAIGSYFKIGPARLFVHAAVLLIVIIWLIPTLGIFVSALRDKDQIVVSGWWTAFVGSTQTVAVRLGTPDQQQQEGAAYVIAGNVLEGQTGREVKAFGNRVQQPAAFKAGETADLGDGETLQINSDGSYRYVKNAAFSPDQRPRRIYASVSAPPEFTMQNYNTVLRGEGIGQSFINSLTVTIPATIIPILIAAFAAYALSWMEFPGRALLIALVVGLIVVPLQMSLIPLLRLYNEIGNMLGQPSKTYPGIWLAHTAFGMPLAIYLLRAYIAGLPKEIIESARVDGASDFEIFVRIVLPLSFPALASFAIFQFLWVWNDLLVAMVFLGTDKDHIVLTGSLNALLGSRGGNWEILTASAFVTIIVPLLVFFGLQRYLVRGLLAGSVKGG